jgi:hypothetical protein
MKTAKTSDGGGFTKFAVWLFEVLKLVSPCKGLSKLHPHLKNRSELSPEEVNSHEFTRTRVKLIDRYVAGCIAVEISLCALVTWVQHLSLFWKCLIVVAASVRIIEIVQVTVNVAVFDRLKRRDNKVASFDRLVVLSFVNFLELCICFDLLYASDWHRLSGAGRSATAFYFSAITQTTIGYGDVYPTGYLRIIASCQGIISLVFAALVFSRFVGTLPPINAILDDGETEVTQSKIPRTTTKAS